MRRGGVEAGYVDTDGVPQDFLAGVVFMNNEPCYTRRQGDGTTWRQVKGKPLNVIDIEVMRSQVVQERCWDGFAVQVVVDGLHFPGRGIGHRAAERVTGKGQTSRARAERVKGIWILICEKVHESLGKVGLPAVQVAARARSPMVASARQKDNGNADAKASTVR